MSASPVAWPDDDGTQACRSLIARRERVSYGGAVPAESDRLEVHARDGVVVVAGELDAYNGPDFNEALASQPATTGITIDLSGVSFLDSSALRVLVVQRERFVAAGQTFRLRAPSTAVVRLLELSGLVDQFETIPG
jgi:anti-sigma B factor antagonist